MINTKEALSLCLNYIENNINERISLDDISIYTGISKYYLHRMFKALTGETLIDYVQSRKLTSSINELISTNMRIIDIAMEYGFDHEQSYIRAFRKKFGYTPQKVRYDQISMEIKEKININDILSINNSVIYRPFYVFRQKFNIIGIQHQILSKSGDNVANTLGRDFFYNNRHKITNALNPDVYIGYTNWEGYDDGYIYYMPSIQVSDLKAIPEGMTGITIPAHKYVVFRFVGFFHPDKIKGRQVGRMLVHLYRKWITNSGFTSADQIRFEYIDTSLSNDSYCELDIYQPIIEEDSLLES
ncbi:MAG: helix-turn-helix domain-containing protein [Clostridiaceae bacterium]|nr:helix-turn-helix domain-containing protein [Clostridiaceae bacterium]